MPRFLALAPAVAVACAAPAASPPATPIAASEPAPAGVGETPTPVPDATPPTAPSPRERPPDTIFRAELVRATHGGKPAYLLSQLAPQPYRPTGRFQGWLITQVFPDDPELCAVGCDLVAGDVVLSINGSPLERPEQLSALVEQIDTLDRLAVRLIRDADPATGGLQGRLHERTFVIAD